MAASVTPNNNHDGHQHGSASSHGPVPGSPTLTNPDMILPDYDMPDSPEGRSQSPIMLWRDPNIAQMDFELPPQNSNFASRSMPQSTPIIYGNGTMLSDIGEVTEVESTVGPSSKRASSRYSVYTETETYGPSMGNKGHQRRSKMVARNRRASIESTSTVTTQDPRNTFGDFDDSVSIGDSSFHGDDEESMASSYVEGTIPRAARVEKTTNEPGDGSYSAALISNRAEQILANAKRRLTAMEGNLSRARSSLGDSEGSTPSPQMGRPASDKRDTAPTSAPTHSRIKSEDGIRDVTKQPSLHPQRSASALGAAGGYRQPSSRSRSKRGEAGTSSRPVHGISHHPLDTTLEPLSEDDDNDIVSNPDSLRNSAQFSSFLSPTLGTFDRGLTRSASAAQMRDIQDQMHGLKGKISTLKEQARADSLKRRSLQSLRTPSPFTHARWDQGLMEPREIRTVHPREDGHPTSPPEGDELRQEAHAEQMVDEGIGHVAGKEDTKSVDSGHEQQEFSVSDPEARRTPTQGYATENEHQDVVDGDADGLHTNNGEMEDSDEEEVYDDAQDDVADWESESGESLYHDSHQHQMSHEDREDAFDYEHFFLHSAMGNISRQDRRGSSESDFSDDSVETTRGPMSSMSRKRRSAETTASDDTFATATEGRASRSSAFKGDVGGAYDGGYDELPPVHEVGSNEGGEDANDVHDIQQQRHNSVVHRPMSAAQADRLHRPSVSSFESTGTNRSFPLVNKGKLNGGVLTPGGSPDPMLKQMAETLMNDTANVVNQGTGSTQEQSAAAIQGLANEDQITVQRLVASLGKCVLGLAENSKASSEARLLRRRIDAARQILEGQEQP